MASDFAEIQRQVRIACAPEPGSKGAVERVCIDCTATFWDRAGKSRPRCADCSADRAREQRIAQAEWAAARRT